MSKSWYPTGNHLPSSFKRTASEEMDRKADKFGAQQVLEKMPRKARTIVDNLDCPKAIGHGWGINSVRNASLFSFTSHTINKKLTPPVIDKSRPDESASKIPAVTLKKINFDIRKTINPVVPLPSSLNAKIEALSVPARYQTALWRKCDGIEFYGDRLQDSVLIGQLETLAGKIKGADATEQSKVGKAAHQSDVEEQMALVSYAVGAVCGPGRRGAPRYSETDLSNALKHLTSLPLSDIILNGAQDTRVASALQKDLAWRIAYQLAETPDGFRLLEKMTVPSATVPQDSGAGIRLKANLRLFLCGADKLLTQLPPDSELAADPMSLLNHCCDTVLESPPPSNTLLISALPALHHELCRDGGTNPASASIWDTRIERSAKQLAEARTTSAMQLNFASTDDEAFQISQSYQTEMKRHQRQVALSTKTWAANALRNGFYTNAKGSIYDKTSKRLEKMSTVWVDRALRARGLDTRGNALEIRESAWRCAVKLLRKSPFMHTTDMIGATNGALLQREQMRYALRSLDVALQTRGGPASDVDRAALDTTHYDVAADERDNFPLMRNVIRRALIKQHNTLQLSELLNGDKLDAYTMRKMEAEFTAAFGEPPTGASGEENLAYTQLKSYFDALAQAENQPLTPGLLRSWATDINFTQGDLGAAAQDDLTEKRAKRPDANIAPALLHHHFEAALRHLDEGRLQLGGKAQLTTPKPDDPLRQVDFERGKDSRENWAEHLAVQAAQVRLGGSASFSNGMATGVSVTGITAALIKPVTVAATVGAVSGRFNGSLVRNRVAVIEAGVSTPGAFLRVGTRRELRKRGGAGLFLGWKLGASRNLSAGAGVYADVAGGHDHGDFRGVTLRLDRLGGGVTGRAGQEGGVEGDEARAEELGEVIRETMRERRSADGEHSGAEHTSGNLLDILLEKFPHLSVAWSGEGDNSVREINGSVRAGALVSAYPNSSWFGMGANVSLGVTGSRRRQAFREQTGTLRNQVLTKTNRVSGNLQGVLPFLSKFNSKAPSNLVPEVYILAPQIELASSSLEIYKSGTTEQIQSIEFKGELNPRTYKLITHLNMAPFHEKIHQNLDEWANRIAECKDGALYRYAGFDPAMLAARAALVQKQADIVQNYLHEIKNDPHPNTSYIEYLEITPEAVSAINRWRAMAKMARLAGRSEDAATFEKAADTLLREDAIFRPRFLVSSDTQEKNGGYKINAGISVTQNNAFRATNIDVFHG